MELYFDCMHRSERSSRISGKQVLPPPPRVWVGDLVALFVGEERLLTTSKTFAAAGTRSCLICQILYPGSHIGSYTRVCPCYPITCCTPHTWTSMRVKSRLSGVRIPNCR